MDLPNFSPRIYRENDKMKYADGRAKAELDRHAGGRISIRNWQSPADVLRHATVAVMWLRKEGNTTIDVVDPTFEALEAWYQLQEKGLINEIGLDSHDIQARARAREVLEQYSQSDVVETLYDEDKEFSTALRDLVGSDFEYPDFSHLTVGQAVAKAETGLRKVLRVSAAARVAATSEVTVDSTAGPDRALGVMGNPKVQAALETVSQKLQKDEANHSGSYGNASVLRMRRRIIAALQQAASAGEERVELVDVLPGGRETFEESQSDQADLDFAINSCMPLIRAMAEAGMHIRGQHYYSEVHFAVRDVLEHHIASLSEKEILEVLDYERLDDVTGSVLVEDHERRSVAVVEIKRQLAERGILMDTLDVGSRASSDFVILIAPAEPRSYLVLESDEDDWGPSSSPPRSLTVEMAVRFVSRSDAQVALDAAVKRYPRHQFRIDEVPPLVHGLQGPGLLALQETDPRPIVPLDPTRPLYDGAGREYLVVASSEGQVVTRTQGAFGVWDRRSGECLLVNCEGVRLSNERPSAEWIAQRRTAAAEVMSAMHTQAAIDRAQKRGVSNEASGPSFDM